VKQSVARRKPSQDRAQKTQLLIFETAAKLLEQDGLEGFNTNRLAQMSGFSVGTIYQYFADKRAILVALAQHEHERAMQEVRRMLSSEFASFPAQDDFPRARAVVRAILQAFGGRQRAPRILLELALQSGSRPQFDSVVTPLTALLASGSVIGKEGHAVTLTQTDAFVLTQSVMGVVRAALARDARLLRKPQFEEALVDLVTGFVQVRRARLQA
jgi:AcrR family transcriptional regulator